ncbi:amino acid adenylation domain-containing protein, partial [Pseudoduganella buxea]
AVLAGRGADGAALPRRALRQSVPAAVWGSCKETAAQWGISPSSLVFALWTQTLLEVAGMPAATFLLTLSERPRLPAGAEWLIGPFTSSMLVPVANAAGESDAMRAQRLHRELWDHLQHAVVPAVVALREVAAAAAPGRLPVVFTSLLEMPHAASAWTRRTVVSACQTSGIALEHQMWEQDGALELHWDVAEALLPVGAAALCQARLVARLGALAAPTEVSAPLNALQQAYFVARHEQAAHAQGAGCNAVFDVALDDVEPARAGQAWRELVLAHAALHSVAGADGMVRQLARQGVLPVLAITPVADGELAAGAGQVAGQLARLPHPLGQWPLQEAHLLHSPSGAARLHVSFDLLLLDGQSIHQVMAELVRALAGGAPAAPATVPVPAPAAADAVAPYWRARMAALPSGPALQAGGRESCWQRLEERIAGIGALDAACAGAGLTLDHVLLAALGAAWQRETAQPFTLASVWWSASGDTMGPGERSQMAWPVFSAADAGGDTDAAFPALLRTVRQAVADDLRHGGLAGLPYLAPRHAAGTLALPVVYTSLCRWGTLPAAVAQSLRWRTMTPGVALDAVALALDDELVLAWDVDTALLAHEQAARVFAHYAAAVRRAVQQPDWALGTAGDAATAPGGVLYDWLHLRCALPAPEPVQLAFERSAGRHAALPAVRWRGGMWTFDELNRRANRIARQLRARGIGPGTTVAVSVARGPWMVAATLGILKAGGAYVPVEPTLPSARAARMTEVAGCVLALGLANGTTGLPAALPLLAIDALPPCADEADNPAAVNTADSLAYIIFTSGSTGEPKGVAVAHRALQNLFQWCQRRYRFGPGDLGLCVTSLGFDLSVFDLLGLLGDGAAIYVADETEQRDPALLAALLVDQPITFWNSAPTTLDQVSAHFEDLAGAPAARALRLVFLSGDYTPISLPPVLARHFPQARLVSLGGATEATVWSNFHEVDAIDPAWRSIPYGRPIDNARYYILDDAGQPCGAGVEGHLYIAGDVLSLGYFGRPELTQERFLPDPFVPQAGARMYCTGDRAVFAPDGMMFFRGRADRQVKVRGMRIEPEEIEHVLRQHPQVRDVVVLAQRDADGDVKLVAYVVAPEPVSAHALRAFAAQKLPAAMVPNLVHGMAGFPATSNGKLDRAALPWPLPAAAAAAPVAPSPALEQIVAELLAHFQRCMGILPDTERDLWEQGATSFTMIQVSAALKAAHGLKLQVEWLTRRPTVRGIAEMVAEKLGTTAPVAAQAPVPAPVMPPAADVDVLDGAAKQAFLARRADRRADLDGQPRLALGIPAVPDAWFDARGARRAFAAGTVRREQLAQLLGLLATRVCGGRRRHLYPSAGDTYGVQAYVWIKGERVDGVATGYYWYDADAAALVPLAPGAVLPRETQFIYNRTLVDGCALALFLVGEQDAIAPLYGSAAERFQLLEAGYIGQLLMLGQQQCGLGLCPIGSFEDAAVRASLRLGASQQVLHSFLAGPVATPAMTAPPLAFAAPAPAAIGIVGHALRYPGAATPEAFWQMLRGGASVLRAAPQRRGLGSQGTLVGGFLDDIEGFDAALFGIAPSEARLLDPQARLLLEVVWECLERAGHDAASLQRDGERVGVFCGHLWLDYRLHAGADGTVSASGAELAGRIAQTFGFTGPAIAVDTACTGGLAALHLAAGAIAAGDCDSAIVCAVNLLTHSAHGDTLEAMGLVASAVPDGIYDGDCTGWAVGEGAGAVLLRRRDATDAAGDQVLALLGGSHVEQAGARSPFGSPSSAAVEAGLRAVLRRAGLGADDIDYVECAASGAALSDSAEWEALGAVFEGGVRIGSVKPLIGHLEAASGMAQLSKVLLQLAHGELAPTRVAARTSPLVDMAGPVQVVTAAAPLARSSTGRGPARVLISAVASTGGSVQVILAAPPVPVAPAAPAQGPAVLLLSAASAAQLERLAGSYRAPLQAAGVAWPDICATSQLARMGGLYRLAVEAVDAAEAYRRLTTFLGQGSAEGVQQTRAQAQYLDRQSSASGYRGALQDWLAGYQVDWRPFWQGTPRRALLPTYPFERLPYWLEAPQAAPLHAGPTWLERVMAAYADAAGLPVGQLDPHVPLERYGLNSRIAAAVVARLNEQAAGAALHATLLYEARDLHGVARSVASLCTAAAGGPAATALPPSDAGAAIAIVGLAGRYPGADDVATLWQKLAAGVDLVGPVPAQRQGTGPGAALLRGAFLDEVSGFDPFLFGIAPADAARMDPQERILLETTWQALEDAGYPPERLRHDAGGRVGVYVGAMHNEYPLLGRDASTPERLIDTGATPAGIANRISYHLDLHGPSLTVDTMCSSALTALQLAVEALRAGRIEMAIVGSVNLSIHPNKFVQQARLQMTAPGGRCRSFGAGGDGFVPGEGAEAAAT